MADATPAPEVKRQTLYGIGDDTFMVSALSNGRYWLHVAAGERWCAPACDHDPRWHFLDTFPSSKAAREHARTALAEVGR